MDTGEYETNALLINNISSVNFAFYELLSPPAASFGANALELENQLRSDGYLVHVDSARRGLWCFRLARKDGGASEGQSELSSFPRTLERCGYTLSLVDENAFDPLGLAKNRLFGSSASNTPSSSSSSSVSATLDVNCRVTQPANMPPGQPFPFQGIDQDSKAYMSTDARSIPSSMPIKDAYEALVSAVTSAVSSTFCAKTGAVPLNVRTFLLSNTAPSVVSNSSAILGTLRVYLTTTGTLLIAMSLSRVAGIVSLSQYISRPLPPLSLTVLAAPLGVFATYEIAASGGDSTTPGSLGQSPADTQVSRVRPDKVDWPWRNICSKLLQARNMSSSIITSQSWLNLQRVRRKPAEQKVDGRRTPMAGHCPSISWPSSLCFCRALSKLAISNQPDEKSYSSVDKTYDPLSFAKSWSLGAGDRDELLSRKKKERERNATAAAHEATLIEPPSQSTNAVSPLVLRQTAAPPGPVYLTPPDNVQSIVGVTPSIDGTLSSPGNPSATTAMVDVDAGPHIPHEHDGENWGTTQTKRERTGGSFDTENLFGELGPDMFGDADITEADFNFFDEQPDGMDLGPLDLPDMSNPDPASGLSAGLDPLEDRDIKAEAADPPISGTAHSPIFTKPELRHARSLVDEKSRQTELDRNRQQSTSIKRPPSPFTPDAVYKRVRASLDNQKAVQRNSLVYGSQHGSIFEKVDFGPSLSAVNSKYEGNGRFGYSAEREKGPNSSNLNTLPTTDYLKRHGKGRKGLKEPPASIGQLFVRASNAQDLASNRPSPLEIDDTLSDADELSLISDQDDSSYESDEPPSPVKSMSTRRRRVDDDGESLATSFKELECIDVPSPNIPLDLSCASKGEVDLPLSRYFADPEPPDVLFSVPDEAFIVAAQLVTDQTATTTLSTMISASPALVKSKVDCRRELLSVTRRSVQELQTILPSCVGVPVDCQFRPFIEVQDVPFLSQPTRIQPRPPGVDQLRPSNLWQIPSPHFALRRYESKLSVLPSAVTFWESLGLGPSQGNKDINAICIFPDFPGMADSMLVFMDRMRSVYESFKLGSFNRLPTSNEITDGLVAFDVEKTLEPLREAASILGPSLSGGLAKLYKTLTSMTVQETNFVVFFVYSPDISGSMVESCIAFHQLFEGYKKSLASKRSPIVNEMALQLIPIDFVSSSTSLANPSPAEFAKLALETYDRCSLFGGPMPSPAIVLEQAPPRLIDFKLAANPSASLLHENSCLHVAYAQSIDERWIAAAWTDNRGIQQLTASYCLGRKGKSISTPLADVAHEIWETTRDLISAWKVHWRIIIAKCGAMEQHEIDIWSALAQAESKAAMSLTLLTVDTDPSLQLIPPTTKIPTSATSAFYTTPVSTPQPSIVSPEQSAATPGSGAGGGDGVGANSAAANPGSAAVAEPSDADSTLTDVTDHTWGAVLAHRLSINPQAPAADFGQTALISGYLVKRGGARVDDPPVLIEVNVVYVHQHGSGNGGGGATKEGGGALANPNNSSGASSGGAAAHAQSSTAQQPPVAQIPPPLHLHHPRAYEPLLREVLVQFRALGSLARARGVTDREVDARPWHVAAAEKGVRALYLLM